MKAMRVCSDGVELDVLEACDNKRRQIAGSGMKRCQEVGALGSKHNGLVGDGHQQAEDQVD